MLNVPSVEGSVYDLLRKEILDLSLRPGQRLFLDALAKRLGVSHMPVRQALLRLEGEGLVHTLPHRGAYVTPLTLEEFEEIQVVRLGVDSYLARLGAQHVSNADLDAMESKLRDVDLAFNAQDLDLYLKAYGDLRDLCHAAAERYRLFQVAREHRSRAERYLRVVCSDLDALQESRQHQIDFVAACKQRDGATAEDLTRHALLWTLERVGSFLDERTAGAGEAG